MQVNFIAQPEEQLGVFLNAALNAAVAPSTVILVSAFASLQAVLRLKARLTELRSEGAAVRVVVGVDMGGTSKEVLKELASWPIEVFVFKNRRGGVTFHPKLYLVEAPHVAEVLVGSNNLTDGGLYGNYEGAVRVSYELPADAGELNKAKTQLAKFIAPAGPVARRLDATYLPLLLARRDIPDEAESRRRRKEAKNGPGGNGGTPTEAVYGFESTKSPPPLPPDVQKAVLAVVKGQLDALELARRKAQAAATAAKRKAAKEAATFGTTTVVVPPVAVPDALNFTPKVQLSPTSFYLELVSTSGKSGNIPGEQRVPLEAISVAQGFWGWPDNYIEARNPRKGEDAEGEDRIYKNWKPMWRLRTVNDPTKDMTKAIRMYYYVNSSDFRFYSSALVKWAKAGDIIQLTRIEGGSYEYDCVLAVAGTPEHTAWKALCDASSDHTDRVFGFA